MALLPFSSSSHLPDVTLLRLHDGELDAVARRRAQKHLLHCWHCRSRAERLSTTVHTFVGYCDSVFAELRDSRVALTRSAEALRAELHREAVKPDAARRSIDRWAIFRQGWAHLSRPQVSTSLVATLLVGWWLFLGDAAPRAQASELLERAASGEARRLGSVASTPLIHQTLEVRCDAQRAEWEMWHAPVRNQFRERWKGDKSIISALRKIYSANGFNPRAPLSTRSFASWRLTLPDRRETVSAPEEETLSIHVQGRNPGDGLRVTAASITLTGKDLHPVAQSLEVSEPGGRTASIYRIREVSLTVMPFDKAPAGLFEEAHRAAGKKHAPGVEPFSSPRLTPTAAQLEETEARLREVLHKTGLQARLAPRIKVEDRMVIVQAIVEDREQKTRMLSAIGGIPFVRPQIWEPDDSPAAAVTVFEITGGQARHAAPPFAKELKEYFGSTELANDYLGRIQQGLRKSLAAGIALQQLGDRYSPDRLASLPQGAAAAIYRIAADHAAILKNRWPEVNALLEPVLTEMRLPHASAGVQPPGSQECVFWSGTSRDIVMDLRRVETSLHRSFIPYEGLGPAAVDPERLLDEIESARARLNRAIAGTCLP